MHVIGQQLTGKFYISKCISKSWGCYCWRAVDNFFVPQFWWILVRWKWMRSSIKLFLPVLSCFYFCYYLWLLELATFSSLDGDTIYEQMKTFTQSNNVNWKRKYLVMNHDNELVFSAFFAFSCTLTNICWPHNEDLINEMLFNLLIDSLLVTRRKKTKYQTKKDNNGKDESS